MNQWTSEPSNRPAKAKQSIRDYQHKRALRPTTLPDRALLRRPSSSGGRNGDPNVEERLLFRRAPQSLAVDLEG